MLQKGGDPAFSSQWPPASMPGPFYFLCLAVPEALPPHIVGYWFDTRAYVMFTPSLYQLVHDLAVS